MNPIFKVAVILLWAGVWLPIGAVAQSPMAYLDREIEAHAGQSGALVLDTGDEALIARAWLADNAERTIDVQYFIWSTDNVGILAAEALLRAAERGVKVRVIVDDLLIDAPDKSLLALASHPNVHIRIYNPQVSVGVPLQRRLLNAITNFRGVNQRMHDKTAIFDGKVAITGGRNMAAEYYDYSHEFNFRDRDILVLGDVVKSMQANFETFWASELTVNVEELYDGLGLLQKNVRVNDEEIQAIYKDLHTYATSPENFAPEIRAAIDDAPSAFPQLAEQTVWTRMEFIGDAPGKNKNRWLLSGGGLTTSTLAGLVSVAKERIVIQSPYLVISHDALDLLRATLARGVKIRINTNSLASTDNLPAFSGYRSQRKKLLRMGLEIYEYRPEAAAQRNQTRNANGDETAPTFSLHAKTLIVDSKIAFVGTFNFDPRSENLNTEVGVIVYDETFAKAIETAIETDMKPENSWSAADDPDQHVSLFKRSRVRLWQLMPIKSLL